MQLSDAERLARLRLVRTEGIGPALYRQLLARFGSAERAVDALPELSRRGGRSRPLRPAARDEAERELAALAGLGAHLVTLGEPGYPDLLAAVEDAPPALAVHGQPELFARPAVAVVGARNASLNGRRFARDLAAGLGERGYIVVSGLARGIDTAAHEGAIETGTLAAVAGGIDVVYPRENRALHEAIAERGLVVAEHPPGTTPQARHFPRRNRIIAGLTLGVVVVEAAPRSGSLITARLAAEQGREVFAVPGSPLDPRCRGTNGLIRSGAQLIETAEDVIEGLTGMTGVHRFRVPPETNDFRTTPLGEREEMAARGTIVEALGATPIGVDDLVRGTGLPTPTILTALMELELAGRLERHPGNRVSLLS